MTEKISPSLPEANQEKFLPMNAWGEGAFEQLKDNVEVKTGNGDTETVKQALELFSKDIAYSGLTAAYENFQDDLGWDIRDGPKATKFDILIHLFDETRELFTDTESRRQVQALIVNLCGGTDRYKFLYEDGAEDYSVADIVAAVVENWDRTQSKQAKIEKLTELSQRKGEVAQAAIDQIGVQIEPERGEEQRVEAKRFYESFYEGWKLKVDGLAESLLAAKFGQEQMELIISNLPSAKLELDISGRKEDMDLILKRNFQEIVLKETEVKTMLEAVLDIKEMPKKGKDRGSTINENNGFYNNLSNTLRWRLEIIGEQFKVKEQILSQVSQLEFVLDTSGKVEVDLDVQQLIEQATNKGVVLGPQTLFSGENDGFNGEIEVKLNEGWGSGSCQLRPNGLKDQIGEILSNIKLNNDYQLKEDNGSFDLYKSEEKVGMVRVENGEITINWDGQVEQGLENLAVLGRAFNEFTRSGKQFPGLHLGLKEETPPAETSVEETPPPAEEELEASAPEPELEQQEETGELPDWLRDLRSSITESESRPEASISTETEQTVTQAAQTLTQLTQEKEVIEKKQHDLNQKDQLLDGDEAAKLIDLDTKIQSIKNRFEELFGTVDEQGLFNKMFHFYELPAEKMRLSELKDKLVKIGIQIARNGEVDGEARQALSDIFRDSKEVLDDNGLLPAKPYNEFFSEVLAIAKSKFR